MYDYEARFQESFNRAQREYDNQTPEDFYGQDDEEVNLTEEEWEDLYGSDADDFEPDYDSMNEDW